MKVSVSIEMKKKGLKRFVPKAEPTHFKRNSEGVVDYGDNFVVKIRNHNLERDNCDDEPDEAEELVPPKKITLAKLHAKMRSDIKMVMNDPLMLSKV